MTHDRLLLRARATVCLALSLALLLLGATAVATGSAASAAPCSPASSGPSRVGHFGGISRPVGVGRSASGPCRAATPKGNEAPYNKNAVPPLIYHNSAPVMGTSSVGSAVVLTPIFWAPAGYSFTSSYKTLITTYLADLAHDSGASTNVFATVPQYVSSNGTPANAFTVGAEIDDTTAYPASGCTVNSGGVYADNSGYAVCLSDSQLQTEINAAAGGATRDLGHMYLMFTPKSVESCFYNGNPSYQQCTINPSPSAAFCAFHSDFTTASGTTVYANMPFPIYGSPTKYSCTSEQLDGTTSIQQPNGDPDADVEISPLSHEMAEAMTDPLLNAWFDVAGNENGDDCAYIYGGLSGAAGVHYNQTVNGHHYLTQEEFSNADFVPHVSGCLQQTAAPAPTVTAVAPVAGPVAGGTTVAITGTGFLGATAVNFGAAAGTGVVVNSTTSITATAPPGTAGQVDVTVTTPGGTSATVGGDKYSYLAAPTVTGVSPAAGPTTGLQDVTITGTGFTGVTAVAFGSTASNAFTVLSDTTIDVSSPGAGAGTVDLTVTSPGGVSTTSVADHYTYVNAPTVTGLAPSAGSTAGGTPVTITGTGFTGASAVTFGTEAAAGFAVMSATTITATAPPGSGTADVTVTTVGGTSSATSADTYTYVAPPTVTALSPAAGPVAGGQTATITGTGFTGAVAVGFGSSAATTFTVTSDTSITVTVPAHAAGVVNVYVTNAAGHNPAVAADRYTYYAVPTVTRVSPNSGPVAGHQRVTVTGSGFLGATAVSFGTVRATGVTVLSDTTITVSTPAHVAGAVHVRVTAPGGQSAGTKTDVYTYRPVPSITRVSPSSGTRHGRQTVTVTGTGFIGTSRVVFGTTAARFHVVSSTRITVVTPPHAAGTVNVYVTTGGGHNPTARADRYRFT